MKDEACESHDGVQPFNRSASGLTRRHENQNICNKILTPCQPILGSTDSLPRGWEAARGFSELRRYTAHDAGSGSRRSLLNIQSEPRAGFHPRLGSHCQVRGGAGLWCSVLVQDLPPATEAPLLSSVGKTQAPRVCFDAETNRHTDT